MFICILYAFIFLLGGLNSQFIWQPAIQNSSQSSMSSGSLSPGHMGSDMNASSSNFGSTGYKLLKIQRIAYNTNL